jgi:hypothetical protein
MPLDEEKGFLREILAAGPVASKEVKSAAAAKGFSWASVRRAKKALGIKAHKESRERQMTRRSPCAKPPAWFASALEAKRATPGGLTGPPVMAVVGCVACAVDRLPSNKIGCCASMGLRTIPHESGKIAHRRDPFRRPRRRARLEIINRLLLDLRAAARYDATGCHQVARLCR